MSKIRVHGIFDDYSLRLGNESQNIQSMLVGAWRCAPPRTRSMTLEPLQDEISYGVIVYLFRVTYYTTQHEGECRLPQRRKESCPKNSRT